MNASVDTLAWTTSFFLILRCCELDCNLELLANSWPYFYRLNLLGIVSRKFNVAATAHITSVLGSLQGQIALGRLSSPWSKSQPRPVAKLYSKTIPLSNGV